MTTMLWKELRENVKWGALALLGLLMAEFYALNQQQFFGFYVQESAPLCKSSFLMITTFGCAAVGLVIGLVQMLPEQRRDQWAALLHRPVERGTIFRGKAVAGLLIYFVATIVPFVACIWYVSVPGHFAAPFTPRMVFPGVADICAGAMYYFAALFVSLQRGAWWGTRAFGVLAALSGSFVVTSFNPKFYVVIEAAVLMSVVLFAAAWGAMLTNGTFKNRPWLARFAALAVVFYGVCAAGVILNMIWNAFQKPNYYFDSQYEIDIDGRPLVGSIDKDGSRNFHDLAGNPVHDPRLTGGQSYRNTIQMSEISTFVGNPHGLPLTKSLNRGYRSSESYAAMLQVYNQVNNEAWYFLVREQIFAGFNSITRVPVGSIGRNGFVPGVSRAQSFPKRLGSTVYYQLETVYRFGNTVYFLDVGERTIRPIFTAPGISGVASVSSYEDDPVLRDLAIVALPDRCLVVDKNGRTFAALPYGHDMDRWGRLSLGAKSAQGPLFLEYQPSGWIPFDQQLKMPSYLEQFDLHGHVVKSYTLPPLDRPHVDRTWRQWVTECLGAPAYFYGNLIYEKVGAMSGSHRLADELHRQFHEGWGYTKDVGTRVTVLSFLLAAVTLVWARRSEFTREEAFRWALFVLAFNLAGLLTFRLVADWPVRIKCPACGRPRRVDEPTCVHCGATWPAPPRDGTEIIDEPAAAGV